jgi:heptosyltransferase-3
MSPQERFPNIKKILVIKLKHIGDVLLTTPCVRALHETFPGAEISVLLNEGTEAMFRNNPLVKEILLFPRSKIKGSGLFRIQHEISFVSNIRKRRFDMTVDLTSGDRAAWIGFLSRARYRLAYDPQGAGFLGKKYFYTHLAPQMKGMDVHEVKKNLGLLEYHDIRCVNPRLELSVSSEDEAAIQKELIEIGLNSPVFVLVHPTSRWMFKCWEDERVAQMIDWIQQDLKTSVIVTCGPDLKEKQRIDHILSLCVSSPKKLLGKVSLTQWAALVKRAKLFIGVDSAPMHIAAAQGIPSLSLFGPTGYQNWRPWAVPHIVLVHDCPCARDRQQHCDWSRTRACMDAISLKEVQEAVVRLLNMDLKAGAHFESIPSFKK